MRVAIDATPLTLSSGGLLRYTQELSLALAREFPEDTFDLVSDQAFERPAGAPANLLCGGGPQGTLERRWWLWGLDRELHRLSADLFHGTNFAVPYIPRRPSVMTLHDLSPWMDPGWHFAAERVRGRTPLLIELGCATMVVTDTEAVRRQAIERFRIHPGRIAAVPLGGIARSPAIAMPAGRPYFLFVGTLEPRKNVEGLIAAWRHVRRQHDIDLVLAGRRREDFPPLDPEPGLILRGEVPEAELPALYGNAVALVYPSRYEGFGLPVLEAMQCGTFAIISRDPALIEVAGDAAIAAGDERELAEAMSAVVARPEVAAEWKARAACRGREFSWERTARLTREVYDEARKRFSD
jgi:glycosyltransferase involved in cell wall biosynthesis